MTRYLFEEKTRKQKIRRERWETFAAFITFSALVALAAMTFGSLSRDNLYETLRQHHELERFTAIVEDSPPADTKLKDRSASFTVIAPTNKAFEEGGIHFASDEGGEDSRIIRIGNGQRDYLVASGAYILQSRLMPADIPREQGVTVPTVSGDAVDLRRVSDVRGGEVITINGKKVRERIVADNGVIYVVDSLIYPLPSISQNEEMR